MDRDRPSQATPGAPSDADVRAFHDRGYLIVRGLFSAPEVVRMRDGFDRLWRLARQFGRTGLHRGSRFVIRRHGPFRVERVVWCGAAEPVLDRFGRDPRLLRLAARLLRSRRMNQLINQAHFKMPGDGVSFPWHQDSRHRRHGTGLWCDVNGRGSYVQTVTAIDDVDDENGPLRLIPGSGALGHIDVPGNEERLAALARKMPVETPHLTAGDVLAFGPYTVHGSSANRSRRPRRAFLNGFAYPGANTRRYPGHGAGRLLVAET